jgi:hypothetical protein
MQTTLNSLYGLLGMDGSRASNDDSLQVLLLVQHGLVIGVSAATELGLCSIEL